MGVIVSRYLDERSSEGALVRFAIDSVNLVYTICTTDAQYPELTPWNVIDFNTHDITGYVPNLQINGRQEAGMTDSTEQLIVSHFPVAFDNSSSMNASDNLSLEPSSSATRSDDLENIQDIRRVQTYSSSTTDRPFTETIIPINEESSQTDATDSRALHAMQWHLQHTI